MIREDIDYDKLIAKSLKNVVIESLKIVEEGGLPGDHHFYITFKTDCPATQISNQLKRQYPEEMTIILQHQYSNLKVNSDSFEIDLSFGGILQTLKIAFESITYFADPHAKFGLSFELPKELLATPAQQVSGGAEVVSIDSFRKKK